MTAAPVAQMDMAQYYGEEEAADAPAVFSATEQDAGRHVDPGAKKLFAACPWMRRIPVFNVASEAYGPKTTLSLGLTYFMCKGVADQLIKTTMLPMLVTRYGIDATHYQRLAPMASMGWSIKAFTAMFSDGFALFGYTKRWYIAISAVAGGVFAVVYGCLPAKEASADVAGGLIFLTSFFKANFDILAEGHYSRLMRRIPSAGASLVTWIWLLILLGYIIASGMTGPLSDKGLPQICVFVSAGLQILTVVFPIFNWYGEATNRAERAEDARLDYLDSVREHQRLLEERREEAVKARGSSDSDAELEAGLVVGQNKNMSPELDGVTVDPNHVLVDDLTHYHNADGQLVPIDHEAAAEEVAANLPPATACCCGAFEVNKKVLTNDWRLFAYCGIMTLSVLAMLVSNIVAPRLAIIIVCACVTSLCCGLSFWALPMPIAKANVFGFLHMAIYLNIAPLDNFYMAKPDCVPGGPNFDFTFYRTLAPILGNVAGMIGTLGFNYIFSKRSYRVTFMITTSVQILASLFDIVMVKRWNIAIGIPDHAMYLCGDAVIYQVCYMLAWMPMVMLLSRLCPRGSESVVYALVAGFANLGSSTGSVITSILMEYALPISSRVPCNFDNLIWLLVIGHLCLPLLIFPLTLLLPNARCCDDLDVDGKAIRRDLKAKKENDEANCVNGPDVHGQHLKAVSTDGIVAEGVEAEINSDSPH